MEIDREMALSSYLLPWKPFLRCDMCVCSLMLERHFLLVLVIAALRWGNKWPVASFPSCSQDGDLG